MMSIHQADLDPASFQDLKQRNPIHAGRFHRYSLDPTALKPFCEGVEVLSERWKAPDWRLITTYRYRREYFGRPDINAGGVGMNHQRFRRRPRPFVSLSGHDGSP
jgi:hypothetical protein